MVVGNGEGSPISGIREEFNESLMFELSLDGRKEGPWCRRWETVWWLSRDWEGYVRQRHAQRLGRDRQPGIVFSCVFWYFKIFLLVVLSRSYENEILWD